MEIADDLYIEYEHVPHLTGRISRQQAEREAVMRILRRNFGQNVTLLHDHDGAPSVDGFDGYISISHCNGMAAVAIHPSLRIGIDIETPREQLQRVSRKFLTDDESTRFHDIEDLLWAWTAKEAIYKAAGIAGLPLHDIHLISMESATVDTSYGIQLAFRLRSSLSDGIMTTIAIPGQP